MRLQGQAKAGFYPTPEEELEKIKEILSSLVSEYNKESVFSKALDPCAGDGRGLRMIKQVFNGKIKTYAVELEQSKYEQLKKDKNIDVVYHADALNEVEIVQGSVSILFLNPPYDNYMLDEGVTERMETLFLKKYMGTIATNGILIYIVPHEQFKRDMNSLLWFDPVAFYPLKDQIFHQWVFIGRKMNRGEYPPGGIGEEMNEIPYAPQYNRSWRVVNDLKGTPISYTGLNLKEAKKHFSSEPSNAFMRRLMNTKENVISPVTNLREGHLAVVIASGLINGEIDTGKEKFYLRGRTEKRETVREEHDEETKTTKTITLRTSHSEIVALREDGKIIVFK